MPSGQLPLTLKVLPNRRGKPHRAACRWDSSRVAVAPATSLRGPANRSCALASVLVLGIAVHKATEQLGCGSIWLTQILSAPVPDLFWECDCSQLNASLHPR